ncbi:MAG: hypothetical protein JWO38_3157 [Gemmataceae bacterium]|nr:hypothetical protein [Gemmataceae bacterium]
MTIEGKGSQLGGLGRGFWIGLVVTSVLIFVIAIVARFVFGG